MSFQSQSLQTQLRNACNELRYKSMALADFIPLLQKAADRLDQLERDNQTIQAQQFCANVFNKN